MTGIEYLKRAAKTPETETGHARQVAGDMLADIEARGEAAVREYAARLDNWRGDIVVTADEIERRTRDIPDAVKRDIDFATAQVRAFAEAQRDSTREFATELQPQGRPACPPSSRARRLIRGRASIPTCCTQ